MKACTRMFPAMKFEEFFRLVSYAAVFCGFFSLLVSGTFGVIETVLFISVLFGAYFLESTQWQIGEKMGTGLIVLALPIFYGVWYLQIIPASGGEAWIAGLLARMILCLTAVKLLQKKSDRDWIFLYLMSFFEVLLAAGLSISALYLGSFLVYLLVMVCAIIAFEIRKTSRAVECRIAGTTANKKNEISESNMVMRVRRLPMTALVLIAIIVALAMPLFFMLPRVGGAGFGGDQKGLSTSSGFSETVKLGQFGRINQSDEAVMRVKTEGPSDGQGDLYFRGIALDTFDNLSWSKSKLGQREPRLKGERDLIRLDDVAGPEMLFVQTIYLEPLDTPVLFALPRAVAIQGNFPYLNKDAYGSIFHSRVSERISYKVSSDRSVPSADRLRADDQAYTADVQNYRTLPPVHDPKIAELARQITAGVKNRYDKAAAIESFLQTNFNYTLDQKASGRQPLSDFLFNVREGHCEYFASAMAIMLRTQGVATRLVNGFHGGEYNETADVTVVRQRNAHSWVEVYFPRENAWVSFDPTPSVGQPGEGTVSGIAATLGKYIEALETFWIQYFVAFDSQEQLSLAKTVRNGFVDYQAKISAYLGVTRDLAAEWLADVRGNRGTQASLVAIGYAIGYIAASILIVLASIWLYRRVSRLAIWKFVWSRFVNRRRGSIVVFYERMLAVLAVRGLTRDPSQTPLEFAYAVQIPEALSITERYNRVRFGEEVLSSTESEEIDVMLSRIKDSK